jgi:predicted Zn-dependent peptidase
MFAGYIARHYQTENMIMGVSGKYNAGQLNQLIRKYWKAYPKKRFYGWDKVKDSQKQSRIKIEYKDTQQAHLALGFKGFAYGDKRNSAVTVLASILGGGMSSRLFTEVREKRGLGYYVRCSPGSFQDTGGFTVSAGVQVNKITEALKVILAELGKVKGVPVDGREMQKAKEYIKGKGVLALEDNQVRLDWFLERAAFYSKIETPEEIFKKIDAVKTSDVQKVSRELFQNKKMTLAVIGPYKSEKEFKKLLKV